MNYFYKIIGATLLIISPLTISCQNNGGSQNNNGSLQEKPEEEKLTTYLYTPYNSKEFSAVDQYTCEFDNGVDTDNWDICTDIFQVWSFKTENVTVEDGILSLTAKYDYHKPRQTQFYFSSGMLRSKEPVTYGYYEARIKGADLWPGVCPAFWLYTLVDRSSIEPREENTIVYNEIDVIEIQQIPSNKRMMACNMHIMALKSDGNGGFTNDFVTAGKLPAMGKNEFLVDWDAEDDYHIYACENRPDSVVFYIDQKRVAAKPNYFWHMPMHLTLSMGMRTPYETYVGGRQPVATTQEAATEAGFPTSMKIDYIRSYRRDYSQFKNNKKPFNRNDF